MPTPHHKDDRERLREKLIGFGERSLSKSYYPELRRRLDDLALSRALMNWSDEAVFLIEAGSGGIAHATDAACALFERGTEELTGRAFSGFLPPQAAARLRRVLTGEIDLDNVESVFLLDGDPPRETHAMELSIRAVREGANRYAAVAVRDHSERRAVDKALRQVEKRYRNIFENAREGIFRTTPDGRFLEANPAMAQILGYRDPQALIDAVADVARQHYLRPEDRREYLRRLRADGKVTGFEVEFRRLDGKIIWVSVFAWPTFGASGELLYSDGFFLDVTEQKRAWLARRESDEKYRSLFENAVDGIFQSTPDGRFLTVNPAMARMLGYASPEEVLQTITNIASQLYVDANDRKDFMRLMATRGRVEGFETRFRRKDGRHIWASIHARTVRDASGTILAFEGSNVDVTERKTAQETLARRTAILEATKENMAQGLIMVDENWKVAAYNRLVLDMLGLPRDAVERRPFFPDLVRHWATLRGLGRRGEAKTLINAVKPGAFTLTFTGSEGRVLEMRQNPLPGGGLVRTFTDVTARKAADEALRESETRFRNLVENAPSAIFIVQRGEILYRNEQCAPFGALLGPKDGRPFDFTTGVHPEDVPQAEAFYASLCSGEAASLDLALRYHSPDEEAAPQMRWLHCRAAILPYGPGEAILFNLTDITRVKEMEQMLRLKDKMSSLGRVAAGIAHEIRNPLSGVNIHLSNLERLCEREGDFSPWAKERLSQTLESLREASGRIEGVVRRVMDFSKPGFPRLAPVDPAACVANALALCQASLRKARVETSLRLSSQASPFQADQHMIEQVLINLIVNAAQEMEKTQNARRLEISVESGDGETRFTVADSGDGVPEGLREKIFDPFFTTRKRGSGIGLAICRRIIADHGGALEVTAGALGGASFVIHIPHAKASQSGEGS